jgi:regulator of protease activity HflC (stomatin/prohibitin superfamily)
MQSQESGTQRLATTYQGRRRLMGSYDWVTVEMFDDKLREILNRMTADELVSEVPGIYPEVAEHFNNDVLEELEGEREEDDDREDCEETDERDAS